MDPAGAQRSEIGSTLRGLNATALAGTGAIFDKTVAQERVLQEADSPVVQMVDLMIESAVKHGASDVHIEPTGDQVMVRHRIDGLLKPMMDLPKWLHDEIVARIKIMARLDIAERRLPQDGRITLTGDWQEIDLRISTLPTIFGEKIVFRLLDRRKGTPSLDAIGLSDAAREKLQFFLRHQHGMILVVGPTGSGKTTTLCASVAAIRSERTNIVTIEDPVEYQIPGVNQTQINPKINLTFATALRSILRQDPDVVLLGEIRDAETARIAMQAAQTGHLVLSTLHTDDAPSCVTRLMDIGIESYVAASALLGVVAQRLVRRVCHACRRAYTPDAATLAALGLASTHAIEGAFYRAEGCDRCGGTGYSGRLGIYEVMAMTADVKKEIASRASESAIRELARSHGMSSLYDDGLSKVMSGVTTPDELLRVIPPRDTHDRSEMTTALSRRASA
jgi:type II secretory ATPase GspE/PulE/Tfp pilus assembly ATPase PilB-like protein